MIYAITCFFCGFKFEITDKDIGEDRFIDDFYNGLIRCPKCGHIHNKLLHKQIIKGIVVDFKIKEEKLMIKIKDIPWTAVDAICADHDCSKECPLKDTESNKCMPYNSKYSEREVEGVDDYIFDKDPHGYLFVDQIIKKRRKEVKTEKAVCASCRKKVDFIVREGDDVAHIKDSKGKTYHIPYVRKYAYCKECGNEVYVPEVEDYNAKAPVNNLYGKGLTK